MKIPAETEAFKDEVLPFPKSLTLKSECSINFFLIPFSSLPIIKATLLIYGISSILFSDNREVAIIKKLFSFNFLILFAKLVTLIIGILNIAPQEVFTVVSFTDTLLFFGITIASTPKNSAVLTILPKFC